MPPADRGTGGELPSWAAPVMWTTQCPWRHEQGKCPAVAACGGLSIAIQGCWAWSVACPTLTRPPHPHVPLAVTLLSCVSISNISILPHLGICTPFFLKATRAPPPGGGDATVHDLSLLATPRCLRHLPTPWLTASWARSVQHVFAGRPRTDSGTGPHLHDSGTPVATLTPKGTSWWWVES